MVALPDSYSMKYRRLAVGSSIIASGCNLRLSRRGSAVAYWLNGRSRYSPNVQRKPRHLRGRLSVLRHQFEEDLVEHYLVLQEGLPHVVLQHPAPVSVPATAIRSRSLPPSKPRPSSIPRRFRIPGPLGSPRPAHRCSMPTASASSTTLPCFFLGTSVFQFVLESDTDTLPRTHTTPHPSPQLPVPPRPPFHLNRCFHSLLPATATSRPPNPVVGSGWPGRGEGDRAALRPRAS